MNERILADFACDNMSYTHKFTPRPDPDSVPFRLHSHNMHEIYYFRQGKADFTIEGTRYRLKKGMLLLSASGQVHHLSIHDPAIPYERVVIMFGFGLLPTELEQAVFPAEGGNRVFLLNEREQVWFEESCLALEKSNLGEARFRDSLSSMIRMLFTKLSSVPEVTGHSDPQKNDIVNQIVRFINENLTASLSLDLIEKNLYRDKAHLNRIFKNVMRCSIWEYVIQKRVHASRQALFHTGSISAAFGASGFRDYSVFYRNYVRCTGMSPSEDLKRLSEEEQR
ncbi:MAG: helix-turn-helix transcriptional regulator [Clostridia bacterium]|nr:helix-turn-helix transcriptional regulator [Clostridia bacterium]